MDKQKIKAEVSLLRIASDLGIVVKNGRCAATWRGGKNPMSVKIDEKLFCDFGNGGKGGDIFTFVGLIKFSDPNAMFLAMMWINQMYHICPIEKVQSPLQKKLFADGYVLTQEYTYTDEKGAPKHITERYQHSNAKKKKQFLQRMTSGIRSLSGQKTYLYNLPEVVKNETILLCEGEKDCHTLFDTHFSCTPTTVPMGASKWKDDYSESLKDKHVVMFADNDSAGEDYIERVRIELKNIVKSLKIVRFQGETKGFDISDFFKTKGVSDLKEIINKTLVDDLDAIDDSGQAQEILEAKELNKSPLRNFRMEQQGEKLITRPRQSVKIYEEVQKRLLGFPRKVGGVLFDFDKDTKCIQELHRPSELFAWISNKTKFNPEWKGGTGFFLKDEFFSLIHQKAKKYEEVSYAPSFPPRSNVFEIFPKLPPPSSDHIRLNSFIDFFNPKNNTHRILICALFASPLFYVPEEQRPLWIIDSETGTGSGKTTLAESVAMLYCSEHLGTSPKELRERFDELTKRLLSTAGRQKKVVLVDNVEGIFECPRLAELVTQSVISGKPPYGKGEETRPNNLTYIITANSAIVGDSISSRSINISIVSPSEYSPQWKQDLIKYREKYRWHIIADLIDVAKRGVCFEGIKSVTRFPNFEQMFIQGFCKDIHEYSEVCKEIKTTKKENNFDEQAAEEFIETIKDQVMNLGYHQDTSVFFTNRVIKIIFEQAFPRKRSAIQVVQNWVKQGFIHQISNPKVRMLNKRGMLWGKFQKFKTVVVDSKNGEAQVVAVE